MTGETTRLLHLGYGIDRQSLHDAWVLFFFRLHHLRNLSNLRITNPKSKNPKS
jgi:hypothetical protein